MSQAAERADGVSNNMLEIDADTTNVLQHFQNLFNPNSQEIVYCFGENSALDWFGRTVKGAARIRQYIKGVVCAEYVHVNFKKATHCAPIEYRPSHAKTKVQPIIVTSSSSSHLNKVPILPHLKTRAESDVEDEEDDIDVFRPAAGTATKTTATNICMHEENSMSLSPIPTFSAADDNAMNANIVQSTDSEIDDVVNDDFAMQHRHKRFKRTYSPPYAHRRKTLKRPFISQQEASALGLRSLLIGNDNDTDDCSSSSEDETNCTAVNAESSATAYSPLHYVEVRGVLRSRSDKATSSWDQKVRVRISYRKNLSDGHLHFALIIYEDLHGKMSNRETRRNLMSEFRLATDVLATDDATTEATTEQAAGLLNESANSFIDELAAATESTIVAGGNSSEVTPTTEEIAAALESAAFTIGPPGTPTKTPHTPPPTPKRRRRIIPHTLPGIKRTQATPSTSAATLFSAAATPKRKAVRSLRL